MVQATWKALSTDLLATMVIPLWEKMFYIVMRWVSGMPASLDVSEVIRNTDWMERFLLYKLFSKRFYSNANDGD